LSALAERARAQAERLGTPALHAGYELVNFVAARASRHLGVPRLEASQAELAERLVQIERRLDALERNTEAIARMCEALSAPDGDEARDRLALARLGIDAQLLVAAQQRLTSVGALDPHDPHHADFYWKQAPLFEHCSAEPVAKRLAITNTTAALPDEHERFLLLPQLHGLYHHGAREPRAVRLDELPHVMTRVNQAVVYDEMLGLYVLLRSAWLPMLAQRAESLLISLPIDAATLGRDLITATVTPTQLALSDGLARQMLHAAGWFEVARVVTYPSTTRPGPRVSRAFRDTHSFYFVDGEASADIAAPLEPVIVTYAGRKTAREIR
jgi:hypothetical protein